MDFQDLITDLRNIAIEYMDKHGGLDDMDESREEGENDEVLQAIDTLCDYLDEME